MILENSENKSEQPEISLRWTLHRARTLAETKTICDHSPAPFKDEVFSSYFTRAAKVNFAEPLQIIQNFDSKIRAVARNLDIDRFVTPALIDIVADMFNQNKESLSELCINPNTTTPKNRNTVNGSRFCPFCLEEDGIHPYFRLSWRFNFISVCVKHKCYLATECPKCNAQIIYWKTKFDQSIVQCHVCGENIINAKSNVKFVESQLLQDPLFFTFQDKLVEAYKNEIWDENLIVRDDFFRKLWKLGQIELAQPNVEVLEDTRRNSWDKYLKRVERSSQESFKVIFKSFTAIISDLKKLNKPLTCPYDGIDFANLANYRRHVHTHNNLKCPLDGCDSEKSILFQGHFKCTKCSTEFDNEGNIIKKGRNLVCPLIECGSTSLKIRNSDVRCTKCGTVFTFDGMIKKQGKISIECPNNECKSTSTRKFYSKFELSSIQEEKFKCYTCGTVFLEDGRIIKEGNRFICPVEGCHSKEIITKRNGEFECGKCGSRFSIDGTIIHENNRISNCPLEECNSKNIKRRKNHFFCTKCGTEFTQSGVIIKKGIKTRCPLPECHSTTIRTRHQDENRLICERCGTEFTNTNVILKEGRIPSCPLCGNFSIRANADNFVCKKCDTAFTIDGRVLRQGIKQPCPLSTCGSSDTEVRDHLAHCIKCGTIFSANGEIIKKGKRMHCIACGSFNTHFRFKLNNYICKICKTVFEDDDDQSQNEGE
jgi:DNA-directed RNA polymerase subunit RPC12/RpoP